MWETQRNVVSFTRTKIKIILKFGCRKKVSNRFMKGKKDKSEEFEAELRKKMLFCNLTKLKDSLRKVCWVEIKKQCDLLRKKPTYKVYEIM